MEGGGCGGGCGGGSSSPSVMSRICLIRVLSRGICFRLSCCISSSTGVGLSREDVTVVAVSAIYTSSVEVLVNVDE